MLVSKVICQIPNAFEGDMHMKVFTKAAAYVLAAVLCLCCVCAYAEGEEWACPGCGAANTTNFCVKCGTAKPEEIICQACGAKYPLDSGVVFCGDCGAKLEQGKSFISVRYEGDGFSTPEEATPDSTPDGISAPENNNGIIQTGSTLPAVIILSVFVIATFALYYWLSVNNWGKTK